MITMVARVASVMLAVAVGACSEKAREPADPGPAAAADKAGARDSEEAREDPRTDSARVEALADESKSLTDQFQAQLKQRLLTAMEKDGPAGAIEVCKVAAPEIAASVPDGQGQQDWAIGRTALRVRNPDNAPSDWQRRVLEDFSQRAKTVFGAELASMQWHEVAELEGGGRQWRYMRAIPTAGLCLTCHGPAQTLPPPVQAKLSELYPEDQATGFAAGDLRGAFVVTAPL